MNNFKKSFLLGLTLIMFAGMLAPSSMVVKPQFANVHPQLLELAAELNGIFWGKGKDN
jgi:hypothetical protein